MITSPSPTIAALPFTTGYHTPIMVEQIIQGLAIQPQAWYIDATVGGGGHTAAILQAGGRVVALDQDQQALDYVADRLTSFLKAGQLQLIKANFANLQQVLPTDRSYRGALLDLGVSSHQLDHLDRGFSFRSPNLDMRMDQSLPTTAADLLIILPESDLAQLFLDLGQERLAKRFAAAIKQQLARGPITSGQQLAELIWAHSPAAYRHGSIHPATRTFQALRLAVNAELSSLAEVLPQLEHILVDQGRLAVLSFHSLEDRLVKQFLNQSNSLQPVTKKPLLADSEEVAHNPRARSAKLRLASKGGLA